MQRINWTVIALAALGFAQGAAAVQPLEMDNAIVISESVATMEKVKGTQRLAFPGHPLPVLDPDVGGGG